MPEARDRLSRPLDYAVVFQRRRQNGILVDDLDIGLGSFGSPVPRLPPSPFGDLARMPVSRDSLVRGGGIERGSPGLTPSASGHGRSPYRLSVGRENTPLGTARRTRTIRPTSILPSWYPRTPLRDITAIARAIERRRARLGELDGRESETPTPQQIRVFDSPVPPPGAHLEHDNILMATPNPAPKIKHVPSSSEKVKKILLDITNETLREAEFLTPQKKLLNSIDKVEKVVMEELQKMKSTPSAKRAEREKRVRTLMSMR